MKTIGLAALALMPLNAFAVDSYLYEHGKAHLYCELTCKDDTTARTTGAYRQLDNSYYNLGGFWIQVDSYFDRVYLVSDKKFKDASAFCQDQESALKAQDRNIRNWLRIESDVKCKIKAYATVAVVGFISGKAYSLSNHRIVPKGSVVLGLKNGDAFDLALANQVEQIKKTHPQYEESPLLNFNTDEKTEL